MSRRKHRPWRGRKVVITEPNSSNFGKHGIVTEADSDSACIKFGKGIDAYESWYFYWEFEPVDGNNN